MGIVHIPRTAASIAKGYIKRRMSPLSDKEKNLVGVGFKQPPHVYTSRAGLFDVDLMGHMNNASYLTHAVSLARSALCFVISQIENHELSSLPQTNRSWLDGNGLHSEERWRQMSEANRFS